MLFASRLADYPPCENALAEAVLPSLTPGMVCVADRLFFGFDMWNLARQTGAGLLWRINTNGRLPCQKELPDGSDPSQIYPSDKATVCTHLWN